MDFAHIHDGTLKQYLLQTLSDKEAEAIEERYFTDASFFAALRQAEVELICDYLDGKLRRQECQEFENRYLRVPALYTLVEDVRARRAPRPRPIRSRIPQLAWAAALGCAILTVAIFQNSRVKPASKPAPIASVEPSPREIALILTPGVTKGSHSATPAFTLPDLPQNLLLVAELPGQSSPATYAARLFNVDLQGPQRKVWTATDLQSMPASGGRQVTVKLSSAAISPGDYILELEMTGSHLGETYVFRVNPRTRPVGR